MSQQLAPKTDRPTISLSLTQPHSKQQKNRSGTPLAKSLSDDAPLGEARRASTPTKKVLKVVLLDDHKTREKATKTHKSSTDNGVDGGKSAEASVKNGSSDTTNGKKSTNGASSKPESEEVILIEDDSPKKVMRESARQKNTPTRNEAKGEEPKEVKKKATPDTSASSAKVKSPRNAEKEKEVEEVSKLMGTPPATPPKKVEKKAETTSPGNKATASAKASKKATNTDLASDSLLQEPSFKGFENDDMESLMVEVVNELDSPMPPKTLGKSPGGKVLRLSSGPPNRARVSPFRRINDRTASNQQNASTIVNLSTVSEQSTEAKSTTNSPAVGMPAEHSFSHSMRVISGRRTVRPINEICLTAYRNLNDSVSSMNATVGSEINDSFRTPVVSVIGRKRFQNDSPDHPYGSTERIEKEMATDSPKRARFDFNGLMDFVASPVTMLRNRLSRAKLQSTPIKVTDKMMEEDDEKLEIPSLDTSEIEKVEPVEGDQKELADGDEEKKTSEEVKKDEDIEMQSDEAVTKIVGGEEEIVVTEISDATTKRRNCSIM